MFLSLLQFHSLKRIRWSQLFDPCLYIYTMVSCYLRCSKLIFHFRFLGPIGPSLIVSVGTYWSTLVFQSELLRSIFSGNGFLQQHNIAHICSLWKLLVSSLINVVYLFTKTNFKHRYFKNHWNFLFKITQSSYNLLKLKN